MFSDNVRQMSSPRDADLLWFIFKSFSTLEGSSEEYGARTQPATHPLHYVLMCDMYVAMQKRMKEHYNEVCRCPFSLVRILCFHFRFFFW